MSTQEKIVNNKQEEKKPAKIIVKKAAGETREKYIKQTPELPIEEIADQILTFELQNPKSPRPNMDAFLGVFKKEEIEKDKEYLEIKEEVFKPSKTSEASELFFVEQINTNNYLGSDARAERTSRFDDIANGFDAAAEFQIKTESGEYPRRIAIAIDITSGADINLDTKIIGNLKKILGWERLPEIKYYESPITGLRGRTTGFVPLVIGLEKENMHELLGLYSETINPNIDLKKRVANTILAKHPAQKAVIEEAIMQLEAYTDCLNNGKLKSKAAREAIEEKRRKIEKDFGEDVIDQKEKEKRLRNLELEKFRLKKIAHTTQVEYLAKTKVLLKLFQSLLEEKKFVPYDSSLEKDAVKTRIETIKDPNSYIRRTIEMNM